METKKVYKVFRYGSEVCWGAGRRGRVCSSGKPEFEISSPPEFKGDPGFWTPEDLFVAAINACIMMTFLAYAQHKGLELAEYESEAEGVLENVEGKLRFTEITVRPHVVVKSGEAVSLAREIMDTAHRNCFVTNSTTAEVKIFPEVRAA